MIPEVVVAMLACARIGAIHNVVFGGFSPESVRERMEVSEAKALITRRRRAPQGQDAPRSSRRSTRRWATSSRSRRSSSSSRPATDCEMKDGRDVWYHELLEAADDECPAEALDAEHPLFILYSSGSTAKPKGILHTTGGYLTGVACTHKYVFDLKPEEDVYWCSADVGWVTGHSYIVYGPLLQRRDARDVRGRARTTRTRTSGGSCVERYGVTIFYTAPTAIRACMKWGAEYPEKHDLSSLRLLGSVGEPINPKAWLWYHKVIGGERCPIVDTWWQTETGHIMITPLPGITATKPGSATDAAAGHRGRGATTRTARRSRTGQGLLVLTQAVAGHAADALPGRRPLHRDVLREVRQGDLPRRRRRARATRTATSGSSAASTTWSTSPATACRRPRSSRRSSRIERVAECAVIGQADEDTGQAIVAFVTLEGDETEGDDELEEEIREHVGQARSASSRGPSGSSGPPTCPRRARARSCAGCCATSPRASELGDVTTLRDPGVMEDLEGKVGSENGGKAQVGGRAGRRRGGLRARAGSVGRPPTAPPAPPTPRPSHVHPPLTAKTWPVM